eukprot:CAMPEP_0181325246 /NCGR_PEP_ID=MMETSP1101-20121128/20815_1 /TAXON_ID=46948 /ORGANISM="Rhodomonas abbreviata, Strain Caron Lab Isolate" /LENGTH=110 /DNA_ID=CAMNT_0023433525 /DNA_START=17 /DNA_END=349 /DNA_ORIENTATION=-
MSLNDARLDSENRDVRLGRRTLPEEKAIYDEAKRNAINACKPHIDAFAACDKLQGLMVIFNCRKENNAMNDCMRALMTPEHLDKIREQRQTRMLEEKMEEMAVGAAGAKK